MIGVLPVKLAIASRMHTIADAPFGDVNEDQDSIARDLSLLEKTFT